MRTKKRIVIVGGVAAGATAAARARRQDESAEITLIERGKYVSFANCGLPYRISGDITKRSSLLLQTPEGFYSRYRVRVLVNTEAIAIDRTRKTVQLRGLKGEESLSYDSLILATGGSPVVPQIPGVDGANVFRLWTVPDMDGIHAFIEERKPESALVIGGGFIGLEAAEAFLKRGLRTSIVELTNHLMPGADTDFGSLIAGAFTESGAQVFTGRSVTSLEPESGLALLDDGTRVEAGIVLVSAGVKPNLGLARDAGLEIGASGGLVVDQFLRTADPSIWAAGDMIEVERRVDGARVRIPLAGPANRQGRVAAINALGGSERYAGALGTSVFKAMDYTFAMTGLSEKAADAAGFDTGAATVHKGDHAAYFPGAEELSLKLVYDRESNRVLGAQAFGKTGVDKRIDVVATAIAGRLTLADIAELDLCYAPPYSSANDPLNVAAFAALNDQSGYSPLVGPQAAANLADKDETAILDVRTYGDFMKGSLPGSIHIPVDELRDRISEVPTDRPVIVVSKAGFEGHLAVRQLLQAGFEDVKYVSGGITSIRLMAEQSQTVQASI
ncbi:MAG TPA: FAD-dependent oxidoreductase [Spirochaetia bacterium]|nr:FAD-dependent oxidoreductase [Spirochaetia bacterium]